MNRNWKTTAAGLALMVGLSGGAFAQTFPVARGGAPAHSVQTVADHYYDHHGFRPDDRWRWDHDHAPRPIAGGRWTWDRDHWRFDRDHDSRYAHPDPRGPWFDPYRR
jgi:hypothetical protein